jgi:hypothetical protein
MPLDKSGSKESVGRNIKIEEAAGRPPAQAEAIALSTARKASGGKVGVPRGPKVGVKKGPAEPR